MDKNLPFFIITIIVAFIILYCVHKRTESFSDFQRLVYPKESLDVHFVNNDKRAQVPLPLKGTSNYVFGNRVDITGKYINNSGPICTLYHGDPNEMYILATPHNQPKENCNINIYKLFRAKIYYDSNKRRVIFRDIQLVKYFKNNNDIQLPGILSSLVFVDVENLKLHIGNKIFSKEVVETFGNLKFNRDLVPILSHKYSNCPQNTKECKYQYSTLKGNPPVFCSSKVNDSGFCLGKPNCTLTPRVTTYLDKNNQRQNLPQCPPPQFSLNVKNNKYLNVLPSLLNLNKTEQSCPILYEMRNKKYSNICTIFTTVPMGDNKYEYRTLGYEFFGTKPNESSLLTQKTIFAKELHELHSDPRFVNLSKLMDNIRNKINLTKQKIAVLRKNFRNCMIDLQRERQCSSNNERSNVSCGKDTLQKINTLREQINNFNDQHNNWKIIDVFKSKKGYNSCAFQLKAVPNSRQPEFFVQSHMNGLVNLTLNSGGINNDIIVNGKNFTQNGQLFYFTGSEVVKRGKNFTLFRTYIVSQNGLYLEPSDGAIKGLMFRGNKVYLVESPITSWYVLLMDKDSVNSNWLKIPNGDCPGNNIDRLSKNNVSLDNCKELCSRYPECKGISYDANSRSCIPKSKACNYGDGSGWQFYKKLNQAPTLKNFMQREINKRCPKSHPYLYFGENGQQNCCDTKTFGNTCTSSKCCLTPGGNQSCDINCCRTDICPEDRPNMENRNGEKICVGEDPTKYCSLNRFSENSCY